MLNFIKLDINIMNDSKIKIIRKKPSGERLVLMWVALLCIAMKSNISGTLGLGRNIPYTDEMLSAELDLELNTIKSGIELFQEMNMIEKWENDFYYIINFEKYQNLRKIEYNKKRQRERVRTCRERKKILTSNSDVTVTPLLRNGKNTTTDIDTDIDKDYKEKIYKKEFNCKKFKKPSLEELTEYCKERNNLIAPQNFIDYYDSVGWKIGNKSMKDWKASVRTWERNKANSPKKPEKFNMYEEPESWG